MTWCPARVRRPGARVRIAGPGSEDLSARRPEAAATARLTAAAARGLLGGMARESDYCFEALHRAGWSLGEFASAAARHAEGTRGGERFHATGATQAEAWRHALSTVGRATAGEGGRG
jgi:hypothetical protein